MHVRFRNVLDDDGDIVIPPTYRLVVGRRDEAPILVDESDGVDWTQVLIIGLNNFVRAQIVLSWSALERASQLTTHLDDLLVLHTGHENVLLIGVRVILDDIWDLAVRKHLDTFTSLGIPLLDIAIVRSRQELGSAIVE